MEEKKTPQISQNNDKADKTPKSSEVLSSKDVKAEVQSSSTEKANKKSILIVAIILILLFTGLIGYLAYIMISEEKKNGNGESDSISATTTTDTTTTSSTSTTSTVSTTTTTTASDPYEGWLTYSNDLLGYTLRYPTSYTLDSADEHCVYLRKGIVTINIGRGYWNDDFGCFRTGVGAHEIDESTLDYNVNGETYTADEWYEHYECEDGGYGNIYGRLILDKVTLEGSEADFGLEYSGCPKDSFEEERSTVEKIIESVTW